MTESNTLKLEKTSGSVAYLGDAVYRPVPITGITVTPDVDDRQPTPADGVTRTKGGLWNAGEYYHMPISKPADGDDYTWNDDSPLTYAALVRTVYRLQNEVAGLAAQVVELRERMEKWTADS